MVLREKQMSLFQVALFTFCDNFGDTKKEEITAMIIFNFISRARAQKLEKANLRSLGQP